jgi:hypothetical protein
MQGGKQGPGVHLKRTLGKLFDAPRHAQAVVGFEGKRSKDQQIQGAAQQIGSGHGSSAFETYRVSIGIP